MKAITLRDIPEPIAERIQQQAKDNGTSINKTVIEMLSKAVDAPETRRRRFHDLDHLIGRWREDEVKDVDAVLTQQRSIDAEMWR